MAAGPFLQDPSFWAAASGVAFVGIIVVKGGFKKFGEMLDAKSAEIAKQIAEARALRDEAEETLSAAQRRQREAASEAEALIAQAEEDAKLLMAQAKSDIDALSVRRERGAEQKIEQLKAAAVKEVRAAAVDAAVAASREVLATSLSATDKNKIVDAAIADVGERLH